MQFKGKIRGAGGYHKRFLDIKNGDLPVNENEPELLQALYILQKYKVLFHTYPQISVQPEYKHVQFLQF